MLSVFAADCNAIDSSVTTGRDQTEHGNDAVPNFIFNIILAKACYGFWRIFCCALFLLLLLMLLAVPVQHLFALRPALKQTADLFTQLCCFSDAPTVSWGERRICFLAIRARFIWLLLTSRSPPPAQPPTLHQPPPPRSLSYRTQGNSCVFSHAAVAHRAVGGFRVFLLYQGLTFLWVCRHRKQEVERFASRVSSV